MWSLIEEFVFYILDVVLVRHVRKKRGLAERPVAEDAAGVANVYLWIIIASVVATAAFFTLLFVFDCSFPLAFALTVVPCGIYAGIKFRRLMTH